MAQVVSGSINTTAYSNRYLTFSWTATQDIAKNQSTINWSLVGAGSQTQYFKSGNFKVVIAGEVVYESATRINLYNGTKVASGSKTILHKADGSQSFSASVQAAIYSQSVNSTGTNSWELKAIPRYAKLVAAPNFRDDRNPVVSYSNPAGNAVLKLEMGIFNEGGSQSLVPYREVSKTASSYTFNLTTEERNNLTRYSPNSNTASVRFYIKTTAADGTTSLDSLTQTLTITNAHPEIRGIEIKETNTDVLSVTNDEKCIVRGKSNMYVGVELSPQKNSTIKECHITNGSETSLANSYYFSEPTNSKISIIVEDSRGNITTEEIDLSNNSMGYKWLLYTAPTCSATATASLATGSETNSTISISASGDCYSGLIGNTQNVVKVSYTITEKESGDLVELGTVDARLSNNKYTCDISTTGDVDYTKTYVVKVGVKDLLNTALNYADDIAVVTKTIFDWSKDDFNFNVPVKFNNVAMVDFIVEQGTEAMGSNGTWYWQKWNSGKAECYGLRNYGNMGVSSAFGGLYRSEAFQQSLPTGLFKSAPECCNINYAGSSSDWAAFIMPRLPADTSNTCGFYVVRPGSGTISQAKISFYILGRWK